MKCSKPPYLCALFCIENVHKSILIRSFLASQFDHINYRITDQVRSQELADFQRVLSHVAFCFIVAHFCDQSVPKPVKQM